jgi:DNA modification methylase
MTVRYIIGDTRDVTATIPDGSVDLIMTSPPFLALRSYLPQDHPDKHREIGSEATPAAFIDMLLELTAEWGRVLAPHGSICVELGDTYSGSGGAGGDYNSGGLREGPQTWKQQTTASARTTADSTTTTAATGAAAADNQHPNTPAATAARGRPDERKGYGGAADRFDMAKPGTNSRLATGEGWPLAKSKALIPELYRIALAYGINPLTGAPSPAGRWRVRNVVTWARPNPPVGALGDKYRPATSDLVIACRAADRWFDLDAVRGPASPNTHARSATPRTDLPSQKRDGNWSTLAQVDSDPGAGAPPLDYWIIPPGGYQGSHYAVYPPELCRIPILSMCPRQVCVECGKPRRRIVEATYEMSRTGAPVAANGNIFVEAERYSRGRTQHAKGDQSVTRKTETLGWSDCGHNTWRPGVVLDPFAGSGTTLLVAHGNSRDAIGIDIDHRNADLAVERLGMFITIETHEGEAA